MYSLCWIIFSGILLSGCHNMTHVHKKQDLTKGELAEHLRPYVNNPNYLFGKAELPGKVTYLALNKLGVTVIEQGNGIKFILPTDIFFYPNTDEITPKGFPAIDLLVKVFAATDNAPILITGHTDDIGNKYHKNTMAKKLAESIKSHLWMQEIEQKRIITYSAADREPISDNSLRGKALNRRVSIQLRVAHHDTK